MAAKDSTHELGLLLDLEASEQQAGRSLPEESFEAESAAEGMSSAGNMASAGSMASAESATNLVDAEAADDPFAPLAARMRPILMSTSAKAIYWGQINRCARP